MAMKLESSDRPSRSVMQVLEQNETTHKMIPYPDSDEEGMNFQEELASDRFQQVVNTLHRETGRIPLRGQTSFILLNSLLGAAMTNVITAEEGHHTELEQLAIRIVCNYLEIPANKLQFDVKMVNYGDIMSDEFDHQKLEDEEPPAPRCCGGAMNHEEDEETEDDVFNLERAKRRMINSIVQGAAKRGHYLYHIVADELKEITGKDSIIKNYGRLMSINDTMYWEADDNILKQASGGGPNGLHGHRGNPGNPTPQQRQERIRMSEHEQRRRNLPSLPPRGQAAIGGKVEIDINVIPPLIKARGVCFPILVHETLKGVYEIFATHGRGANYQIVEDIEDVLEKEIWDLRLGPAIWDRLYESFTEDMLIDNRELQNFVLVDIFKKPPKEFFKFLNEILKKTDEGKESIINMVTTIKAERELHEELARLENDDINENMFDEDNSPDDE